MVDEQAVTETEVQSDVLSPEEAAQVVSDEGQEPEVTLPSDQETFEVPEKFQGKSMEDVVKAYMELEKMKGGGQEVSQGEEETPPSTEEGSNEEPNDPAKDLDVTKYIEKFEKEGALSEEDYAELQEKGFSKEQVDEEIEYRQWKQEKAIRSVLEPIGLDLDGFKDLTVWVQENRAPEEVQAINEALASSSVPAQQAIIKGLLADYKSEPTGPIHTNEPQARPSKGYANESEFMADISNPSYQHDKSYIKAVEQKLSMTDTTQWGWGV
jgi:hypothetical protein